jgi:hypothetical protein
MAAFPRAARVVRTSDRTNGMPIREGTGPEGGKSKKTGERKAQIPFPVGKQWSTARAFFHPRAGAVTSS